MTSIILLFFHISGRNDLPVTAITATKKFDNIFHFCQAAFYCLYALADLFSNFSSGYLGIILNKFQDLLLYIGQLLSDTLSDKAFSENRYTDTSVSIFNLRFSKSCVFYTDNIF